MKRQVKRKMAPACHSLPRRICFNAIAQIEIRKPGRKWEELFANGSCSRRPDRTSVSLETILETGSSPPVLFPWHLGRGILSNSRPATEAKVKTQEQVPCLKRTRGGLGRLGPF